MQEYSQRSDAQPLAPVPRAANAASGATNAASGVANAAPAANPTADPERILVLDVLRGLATLGILVMNIQFFSMVSSAYLNPTAFGDLNNANYWVWYLSHLFADMKFMSIFSMLFGAGIVLISDRRTAGGLPVTGFHFRRMGWLLVFGLLHAHLLWQGDILVPYALCGTAVFYFRNSSPRVLWITGLLSFSVASGLSILTGLSIPFWPADDVLQMQQETWQPGATEINKEVATQLGPWLQQLPLRTTQAVFLETFVFLFTLAWRCSGLMLIGMALYKQGILTGVRSSSIFLFLMVIAACIGIPVTIYGIHQNFANEWNMSYSFFLGDQFNYWASPLISLGYVGATMLIFKSANLAKMAWPLACVGQMALSNYLFQTVLCTSLFYGHGLGQFGKFSRVEQLITVLTISLFQLIFSCVWLRYFRFGPFEWLWRSLTYWRRQPLRIPPPVEATG